MGSGFNLSNALAARAHLMPDAPGFSSPTVRLSWSEADEQCSRLASFLRYSGIERGERVAILARNSVAAATAIFAVNRADAIVLYVSWRLQVDELAYILADCRASALLFDSEFAPVVERLCAELPGRQLVLMALDDGSGLDSELKASFAGLGVVPTYQAVIADDRLPPCPPPVRGEDNTAVILYTSGTTGRPKGAMLTHNNFLSAGHSTASTIAWNDSQRFLLVVPLFHISGLECLVISVQTGTALYFLPAFNPLVVWDCIRDERITNMMLVPQMLASLLDAMDEARGDPASLVNITCGASLVPPDLITAWGRLGVPVQQVYGMTEMTGPVTFWKASMGVEKIASHGKTAYLNRIRIVDPQSGTPLPTGIPGEIEVCGPAVFKGYWNRPDETELAFRNGWLRSGDIGYLDADGFLYLIARLKDLIISGGENIYPAEIERVLGLHPSVQESAVVGRANSAWGEVPVAFIVLRPGSDPVDDTALLEHCRNHLASFKCPRTFIRMAALPRNEMGKVIRPRLREVARMD